MQVGELLLFTVYICIYKIIGGNQCISTFRCKISDLVSTRFSKGFPSSSVISAWKRLAGGIRSGNNGESSVFAVSTVKLK